MQQRMSTSSRSQLASGNRLAPRPASRRVNHSITARATQEEQGPFSGAFQKAAFSLGTAVTIGAATLALQFAPPAEATLAPNPIKNASAILRYALPIDNKPIRQVQKDLEGIADQLRIPGSKSLGPIGRSVNNARDIVGKKRNDIIKSFAPDKKAAGIAALDALDASLADFQKTIEAKDKQAVPIKQRDALTFVGQVEEAMVAKFPFEVPAEYADRPLLKGRATVEMLVSAKETPDGPAELPMTITLDGYSAPVSAGQFMDLVQLKFYDNMDIQRSDGFVVQTGKPEGKDDGFRDPATGKIRTVPMEVKAVGDKEPVYEFTLEDLGRSNDDPVLPFNAFGTLAMARNEFENNSGSSQVFFLLKESELTPSGSNLLDGRFAVFGYVTEGQDNLSFMKVGDKIKYVKVTDGAENLINPTIKKAPAPAAEE